MILLHMTMNLIWSFVLADILKGQLAAYDKTLLRVYCQAEISDLTTSEEPLE